MEIKKVASIIEQLKTTHKPFKVRTSDHAVFVGKLPTHDLDPCIINELLAVHLLKLWQIDVPEVCILDFGDPRIAEEMKIKFDISSFHKLGYGSRLLSDVIDFNIFMTPVEVKGNYFRSEEFILSYLKIALFDIWVENTDRHKNNFNLLVKEKEKNISIIPIDHVTILYPAYDTEVELLRSFEYYNDLEFTLLGTGLMPLIKDRFIGNENLRGIFDNYFSTSVSESKNKFRNFVAEYGIYF